MFDDPKKELDALQAQLEAREDWVQRELDSAKRMIGEVPAAPKMTAASAAIPARKAPVTRNIQPQPVIREIPEIQEEPRKKGIRGLVLIAGLELLGILGIAGYWLLVVLR